MVAADDATGTLRFEGAGPVIEKLAQLWSILFKPHSRPDIARALCAIEEKKAAGEDLRRTMKRLAEKI